LANLARRVARERNGDNVVVARVEVGHAALPDTGAGGDWLSEKVLGALYSLFSASVAFPPKISVFELNRTRLTGSVYASQIAVFSTSRTPGTCQWDPTLSPL
jgi:hypothetical protein